jgi:hypothetical protein
VLLFFPGLDVSNIRQHRPFRPISLFQNEPNFSYRDANAKNRKGVRQTNAAGRRKRADDLWPKMPRRQPSSLPPPFAQRPKAEFFALRGASFVN